MESIIKYNRCIGFTKNNKKCRAKINNNNGFFCCREHEPKNNEILISGCYICSENIVKSSELLFFKCRHAVHKECYEEWLKFSTYETPICIICRDVVKYNKNRDEARVLIKYKTKEFNDVKMIYSILHKKPKTFEINIL